MVGFNFRLGEIECAIGIEQIKKLKGFVAGRQHAADRLTRGLQRLKGLRTPIVKPGCTSVYYVYPMVLDEAATGVPSARIAEALKAEGITGLATSYQNLHLLPMYQRKIAYGSRGFPWTSDICHREVNYRKGICPVAEGLHESGFLALAMCKHELPDEDVDLIIASFEKVWDNLESLA
jgi:dTDP-4-amino-4,6-dideoxygalactose transaminase